MKLQKYVLTPYALQAAGQVKIEAAIFAPAVEAIYTELHPFGPNATGVLSPKAQQQIDFAVKMLCEECPINRELLSENAEDDATLYRAWLTRLARQQWDHEADDFFTRHELVPPHNRDAKFAFVRMTRLLTAANATYDEAARANLRATVAELATILKDAENPTGRTATRTHNAIHDWTNQPWVDVATFIAAKLI